MSKGQTPNGETFIRKWIVWKSNNQGVKEETFTQTGRRCGEEQLRWGWCMARLWPADQGIPHLHVEQLEVRQTMRPKVPVWETKASKSLAVNTCEGCGGGRNSQPHRRVHWRDQQGPRMYTNPPTLESAPEGLNLLVGNRGSDWKPAESQASGIVPSLNTPWLTAPQQRPRLPHPGEYLRL